jgi:hypothetical protein
MRVSTHFASNRMTGNEQQCGWVAATEDIMTVRLSEGFEECKRETTTSRRDRPSAGEV